MERLIPYQIAMLFMSVTCLVRADVLVEVFDDVQLVTLKNSCEMEVKVTNYGGIITTIRVPDRHGRLEDVVLGYDDVEDYMYAIEKPYFGAIVGRYANRIAKGKFTIDGTEYSLALNNHPNSLHGGKVGFDKVLWEADTFRESSGSGVRLSYLAKHMEEGFPGSLKCVVTYTLTDDNEIVVRYFAETDKPTPVNLTQHSYFNLKGEGRGTILDHELMINAGAYTPVDDTMIPTGELSTVEDSPFDFRKAKPIGRDIDESHEQLAYGKGYDHNWVLNPHDGEARLNLAAALYEPTTGRYMEVFTDQPGLQFYSGNFLTGRLQGKSGRDYTYRGGLCLETQHYPDSPNRSDFPSTILRPGEIYETETVFKFSTKE